MDLSPSVRMLASGHMIQKFIPPTRPKIQVSGASDSNSTCAHILSLLRAGIPKHKQREKSKYVCGRKGSLASG